MYTCRTRGDSWGGFIPRGMYNHSRLCYVVDLHSEISNTDLMDCQGSVIQRMIGSINIKGNVIELEK